MRLEDRGRNLRATVTADLMRYAGEDCRPWSGLFFRRLVRAAYEHPGLLAVLIYRYGQWVQFRCRIPVLRQICDAYYYYLFNWARTRLQIEVPRTSSIDAGFRIDHFGSILINCQIDAGRGFTVTHGVVVGQTDSGVPRFGDNVAIGVGAKVIGGIRVGSHVIIGAGSVVTKDVPDGAIVAGVPAKVLRLRKPSGGQGESGDACLTGSQDEEDRGHHPAYQD